MQGTDAPFPVTKSDLWNLGELVHALTIFSHVHALCSIVGGCGVLPESDFTPLVSRKLTESLISYTSSLGLDRDSSNTREIIAGGRQFLIEGCPEETEVSDLLTLMAPPETDFDSTDESGLLIYNRSCIVWLTMPFSCRNRGMCIFCVAS